MSAQLSKALGELGGTAAVQVCERFGAQANRSPWETDVQAPSGDTVGRGGRKGG